MKFLYFLRIKFQKIQKLKKKNPLEYFEKLVRYQLSTDEVIFDVSGGISNVFKDFYVEVQYLHMLFFFVNFYSTYF